MASSNAARLAMKSCLHKRSFSRYPLYYFKGIILITSRFRCALLSLTWLILLASLSSLQNGPVAAISKAMVCLECSNYSIMSRFSVERLPFFCLPKKCLKSLNIDAIMDHRSIINRSRDVENSWSNSSVNTATSLLRREIAIWSK